MKNELLTIGPFTVYGYGLMIAIGILAAYLTGEYRAKKKKWIITRYSILCSGVWLAAS